MSSPYAPSDDASERANPEPADPRYARAASAAIDDFAAMADGLQALPPGHSSQAQLVAILHPAAAVNGKPPRLPTLKFLRTIKKTIVRIRRDTQAALNQHKDASGTLPSRREPSDRNPVILQKALLLERIVDLKIEQVQNARLLRRFERIVSKPSARPRSAAASRGSAGRRQR